MFVARRHPLVFVGGGPGDPELLTVKAARIIAAADIILHDALVSDEVLALARPGATLIDVGKRCGRHAMRQSEINDRLVAKAQSGARVVRLKGGDPGVFGRLAEELAACAAAGIAVEIVPGITAAAAAAASLAAPLTDRAAGRMLHLVAGHGSGDEPVDWAGLARLPGSLVLYMAGRDLDAIAAALIAGGLDPATPAVAVRDATRPGEQRVAARLADLPAALAARLGSGPVVVLIGAAFADTQATQTTAAALSGEVP